MGLTWVFSSREVGLMIINKKVRDSEFSAERGRLTLKIGWMTQRSFPKTIRPTAHTKYTNTHINISRTTTCTQRDNWLVVFTDHSGRFQGWQGRSYGGLERAKFKIDRKCEYFLVFVWITLFINFIYRAVITSYLLKRRLKNGWSLLFIISFLVMSFNFPKQIWKYIHDFFVQSQQNTFFKNVSIFF